MLASKKTVRLEYGGWEQAIARASTPGGNMIVAQPAAGHPAQVDWIVVRVGANHRVDELRTRRLLPIGHASRLASPVGAGTVPAITRHHHRPRVVSRHTRGRRHVFRVGPRLAANLAHLDLDTASRAHERPRGQHDEDAVLVEERLRRERLHIAAQIAHSDSSRRRAGRALSRLEDDFGQRGLLAEWQDGEQLLERAELLAK